MANPKYAKGTVLVQTIYEPNSIPWFKDQMYVVQSYDPIKMHYMIRGTADNFPRFYNEPQMDINFTVSKGPRRLR